MSTPPLTLWLTAALLAGAAGGLAACDDPTPTWAAPGETVHYDCPLEGEGARVALSFSRDGRSIAVSDRGRKLRLRYLEEQGDQEVFKGDGYTLTLDPDVMLVRPDRSFRGPCKSEPEP